jgi:iron complex outermembrane receptor protein
VREKQEGAAALGISVDSSLQGTMPAAPSGRTNILPGSPGGVGTTEAVILGGEYDFNDRWTGYAKLGRQRNEFEGQFAAGNVLNLQANGDGFISASTWPSFFKTVSAEAGLRGRFQTGTVSHALALSASRLSRDSGGVYPSGTSQPTNIYAPAPILSWPVTPTQVPKTSEITFGGLALADTLGFMDDRVLLTLGVRRQDVKTTNFNAGSGAVASRYDKSAWTPMAGLVVKPTDDLSLYANVIQGLSQGTTVGDAYLNAGQAFPPYKTKQIELGAKLQTGRFTNTITVFQMEKPSTTSDNSTTPLPTLRLDGEQRNRGIEWTIFGELTHDLRVLGGVTYTQAKLSKTQGGLQDGNQAPGSPRWVANLGADWDVPGLSGLALNGRVIHTSRQYIDNANSLQLPSWTVLNLGARYATRLGGKNVVFRTNVDNVFDRNYWQGTFKLGGGGVILGAPRTFRLSASIDF